DLLDAVSDSAAITLAVRGQDGALRPSTLAIPDPAERRRLTEPSALMGGLGIRFYEPPIPAVLGAVEPDGPAAHAGLKAGACRFATVARLSRPRCRCQCWPRRTMARPSGASTCGSRRWCRIRRICC